ncbi:molybdenum cofactor sulfurase [Ascosphaera apis ARSEF 7405]|uniref:Molybdenum cofactor sulfurase n=1 Tax=Ascosphaera apis ARSEF 7405 TaxID=392613 RepID=A0A167WNI3_9EURO|nr:molybdenum cofactor sulfurase [Ascosphaera apis ARSEF 7405]
MPLVKVYKHESSVYGDCCTQGPILTFNLRTGSGDWIGKSDVEKTAAVKNIQLRTGTLCNPGAMSRALGLSPDEMRSNFETGQRCGDDNDILSGKPTGAIRVSLGAMSTVEDVDIFIRFLEEFYLEKDDVGTLSDSSTSLFTTTARTSESSLSSLIPRFSIKKLCVYPIKSCGAFTVPADTPWPVTAEGLAWDRTWCLIHQGTGAALNQKRYPKMALIKPLLDEARNIMHVRLCGPAIDETEACPVVQTLDIALIDDDSTKGSIALSTCEVPSKTASRVCGENINLLVYSAPEVDSFFSDFLGVPCTLAKFPGQHSYMRRARTEDLPGRNMQSSGECLPGRKEDSYQLRLSNESPMLLVSQSSVNRVNALIRRDTGNSSPISADVFRANIVVEEKTETAKQHPYIEDSWSEVFINRTHPSRSKGRAETVALDVLGSCRRCQMVCIDQSTAIRSQEPFATLAKTRKVDGRVLFGRHVGLSAHSCRDVGREIMISVGDEISTR